MQTAGCRRECQAHLVSQRSKVVFEVTHPVNRLTRTRITWLKAHHKNHVVSLLGLADRQQEVQQAIATDGWIGFKRYLDLWRWLGRHHSMACSMRSICRRTAWLVMA